MRGVRNGRRGGAWGLGGAALAAILLGAGEPGGTGTGTAGPQLAPEAAVGRKTAHDDRTFRPTVLIRKGTSRGSGTVVASRDDETLILTAAHVVADSGELLVELHRYNLGVEAALPGDRWPRLVRAEVAARDAAADVAVVRIRRMVALPFVARLADALEEPAEGAVVTSVGIDGATHLSSWSTRVRGLALVDIGQGGERPFLLTERPPAHGRSGGGLYDAEGRLVGVCVAFAQPGAGRRFGLFASGTSIRRLLRESELDVSLERAADWRAAHPGATRRHTPITPTRARQPAR